MICECTDCGHEFTADLPMNFACPACRGKNLKGRDYVKIPLTPISVMGYRMRDGSRKGKSNQDSVKYTKRLSFFHKDQEWHLVERRFDRILDKYDELITRRETGEVLRAISEPLSRHRGHGSASVKFDKTDASDEKADSLVVSPSIRPNEDD